MNLDLITVISGIFGLVTPVMFFQIATNVNRIKQHIQPANAEGCFDQARKFEFKNDTKKALDMYYEGLYLEYKDLATNEQYAENRTKVLKESYEVKIKALGGTWPNEKNFIN